MSFQLMGRYTSQAPTPTFMAGPGFAALQSDNLQWSAALEHTLAPRSLRSACPSPATSSSSSMLSSSASLSDAQRSRYEDGLTTASRHARESKIRTNKSGFTRSRTGCLTCRTMKKKCDEARPICTRCKNNQHECRYPDQRLPISGRGDFAMQTTPKGKLQDKRSTHNEEAAATMAALAGTEQHRYASDATSIITSRHAESQREGLKFPAQTMANHRGAMPASHRPRQFALYRSTSTPSFAATRAVRDGFRGARLSPPVSVAPPSSPSLDPKLLADPLRRLAPLSSLRRHSRPSTAPYHIKSSFASSPLFASPPSAWSTSPSGPLPSASSFVSGGPATTVAVKPSLPPISTFDRILRISRSTVASHGKIYASPSIVEAFSPNSSPELAATHAR